ncbi:uncharacterized protein CTRU02_203891 [Colletotrichum truncatum]|uniref:Uncharacterized protein n=1 Tax=Colletotrichum truncatum TaxID=5467 RepID=A0ACC3ZAF9_COLTU
MPRLKNRLLRQSRPILLNSSHRLQHTLQRETPGPPARHHQRRHANHLNRLAVIIPRVVRQKPRQPRLIAQSTDASEELLVLLPLLRRDVVLGVRLGAVTETPVNKVDVRGLGVVDPELLRAEHALLVEAARVRLALVPPVELGAVLQRRLVDEDEAGKVRAPEELDVRPEHRGTDRASDGHDVRLRRREAEVSYEVVQVRRQAGDVVAAASSVGVAVSAHVGCHDPEAAGDERLEVAMKVLAGAAEAVHEEHALRRGGGSAVGERQGGLEGELATVIGAAVGVVHARGRHFFEVYKIGENGM